jgi:hypothetical protein
MPEIPATRGGDGYIKGYQNFTKVTLRQRL